MPGVAVMSLLKLPTFPERPVYWLPYHVLLNSEHHRIVYCARVGRVTNLPEFLGNSSYFVDEWRDWFTDEPLKNGDWIIPA